ncbi:LacI family transcriptional regulator [Labedella gwakjiensis]|uniref:LacI family transcriptional regulator n=1 Tax=Labedella gwakjiensis TaxID=390269 RepID=A0A2P8GZD4_9MICO|nr:LacI family DNA-binding transcriptional regulator [Labedella gwakjiensis]PSL39322.1 LacI family transcriptional regulator [Labedella gwakjiensis]RUQ86259.1 LacI family transcriptional regulator [Labedella gwakjiensis]
MSTGDRPRRPTVSHVAAEAGVSRGTVSRYLNGGHWVSPEAEAAVAAAIRKTGYRINPHARSLATQRTNSVAFLLTETFERLFEDPNFARLMRATSAALAERDVSLVFILAGSPAERRRARDFITQGHVDGVLLVSSHQGEPGLIEEIHRAGVPIIACGVPLGFERKLGWVAADDEAGAREMTAYLRSLGRSRIATIAGPRDTSGGVQRLVGFRSELGDDFDADLVEHGDYSEASGRAAMSALLDRDPTIDAVFAANDLMAAGALAVLAERGISVPERIAVGGFDDAAVATETRPALTTMRQPFDRISQEMVRLLLQVIGGEKPAAITLPTELVVRDSA